jgi:subtilase family serine protease
LRLAFTLPLRNSEALAGFLQRLYDPSSPDYHHYLTPAQFNERFGPAAQDYQTIIRFAKTHGLKIVATHDSRLVLDVLGKVADVEKAFHVVLQTYRHPTEDRTFYAPAVEPTVETDLPLLDIFGLADYALPRPALRLQNQQIDPVSAAGSGPAGYFLGQDFRNAYAPGVSLTGAGQRVGLLELDGYYASDIAAYESMAHLTNVPLVNVALVGYTGPPGAGESEVSLDIEMAIAMAPGLAAVVVFEAPSSSGTTGWMDILDSMASSNQISQFSCSWGYVGPPDPNTSFDTEFQKMAAQGQSFFQASGDGDAWINPIYVPADSPYLTSVGGTHLTMNGSGVSYNSETVWDQGNQGPGGGWPANENTGNSSTTNNYKGSGGGVSTVYAIPYWQQSAVNSANQASASMRNIPDVALTANPVWINYLDGIGGYATGTSCAAPLWAGFTSLVNQQAAARGGPPVGFINPAIYAIGQGAAYASCFHDITSGNNTNAYSSGLYTAVSGYDLCTGWGSPNGAGLIDALSPIALKIQVNGKAVVLSWNDPTSIFALQAAPSAAGVFTNVPGAASPYYKTHAGAQQFFRLVEQ